MGPSCWRPGTYSSQSLSLFPHESTQRIPRWKNRSFWPSNCSAGPSLFIKAFCILIRKVSYIMPQLFMITVVHFQSGLISVWLLTVGQIMYKRLQKYWNVRACERYSAQRAGASNCWKPSFFSHPSINYLKLVSAFNVIINYVSLPKIKSSSGVRF